MNIDAWEGKLEEANDLGGVNETLRNDAEIKIQGSVQKRYGIIPEEVNSTKEIKEGIS